jgi:hypothetical protein
LSEGREPPPSATILALDKEELQALLQQVPGAVGDDIHPTVYLAGKPVARNLIVTVHLGGVKLNALVDTAAQVSLVNKKRVEKLLEKLETTTTYLQGIGKDPVPATFAPAVTIQVGDLVDNTPMYFADLDVDMLLGLDFLVRHRAVVDLAKHEV